MAAPSPELLAIAIVGSVVALAITFWAFWPAFRGAEAARQALGTHRLALASVIAVLVLSNVFALLLTPVLHLEKGLNSSSFLIVALLTDLPMLLFVYVRLIMPGALTWQDLGLRPISLDRVLRFGLGAGVAALIGNLTVTAALSQVGLAPNQLEQFNFALNEGPLAKVLLLVFAVIVAPCVEELFFRGFIFGMYRRCKPRWVAYVASSTLFVVPHLLSGQSNPAQLAGLAIGILLLALLLTWIYDRTGSLYPAILAHAVNNGLGLLLFYAASQQQ
jgi:membrane protease YdiL (CAAX protease family)